jgi:hypothetical protein
MRVPSLRIAFLIALAVAALLLAGCRGGDDDDNATEAPQSTNLQIDVAYEPDPPEPGDSVVIVTVMDAEGNPVEGASVSLLGDMDMAMPPELGETDEGEAGVYRVPFTWSMGGEWFLHVTVTLPDGTTVTEEFTLNVGGDTDDMDGMDMDATEEAGMDMEGDG